MSNRGNEPRMMYLTAMKDPKTGMYKSSSDPISKDIKPYQPKVEKPKPYQDPVKRIAKLHEYKPYKPKPIKTEYKPFESYKEYKGPQIDPLTGKPYGWKRQPQEKKDLKMPPRIFPEELGSSTGTIKRTFLIQQSLNF